MSITTPQRTLIHGGPVVTQNDRRETHEALVIEGNRILGTGSLSDMGSLAGTSAKRIDVKGACVMPGILDSHPHFLHFGSQDVWAVNLYDAKDHADIVARLRAHVAHVPAGFWVLGTPVGVPNYFHQGSYKDLAEGELPNRHVLDTAAPDHPFVIFAVAPVNPNIVAFNSKALQVLGITGDTPDRVGDVWIEKDKNGEPTGIMRGSVTWYYNPDKFFRDEIWAKIMTGPPPEELWYQGGLLGQQRAHYWGTTGAYECHAMELHHLLGYKRLRDEKQLKLRVVACLELGGESVTDERIRSNMGLASLMESAEDDRLRFIGGTLGQGGPCWPGFMLHTKPYKDPYGRPTEGKKFFGDHMVREAMHYCADHKLRLNMVLGGLAEPPKWLDLIDQEGLADHVRASDWVSQHNIMIDRESIRRMAALKMNITTSMSFRWGKGDMIRERMGDEVMEYVIPVGTEFASGANVSLGTDWSPWSPFEHMKYARTGELALSDFPCDPATHTVSAQQALDGWTVNTARLMQWHDVGALKPGHRADIAIVDHNPLTADLDSLAKTKVMRTIFDGSDVYDTGQIDRIDEAPLPARHPSLSR